MANANKKEKRKKKRLGEIVGGEKMSEEKALIEGTCDDWIEGQILEVKNGRKFQGMWTALYLHVDA